MIRINLLPPSYLRDRRLKRELWLVCFTGGLAVLVTITLYLVARAELSIYQNKVTVLEAAIRMQLPYLNRIQEYQQTNRSIQELLSDKKIQRVRLQQDPVVTLQSLRQVMPGELRLYTLEIRDGTVIAAGRSSSYRAVTAFVENLAQSPRFTGVQLRYVNATSQLQDQEDIPAVRELDFAVSWQTREEENQHQ